MDWLHTTFYKTQNVSSFLSPPPLYIVCISNHLAIIYMYLCICVDKEAFSISDEFALSHSHVESVRYHMTEQEDHDEGKSEEEIKDPTRSSWRRKSENTYKVSQYSKEMTIYSNEAYL